MACSAVKAEATAEAAVGAISEVWATIEAGATAEVEAETMLEATAGVEAIAKVTACFLAQAACFHFPARSFNGVDILRSVRYLVVGCAQLPKLIALHHPVPL